MNLYTSLGFVLKRKRHLELDQRLTLFLRDQGKVVALAKGSQRLPSRLKPLLEPFSLADFQVYLPPQGFYAKIISGTLLDSHQAIRHNTLRFEVASRCCETLDLMLPYHAPSPDVFDILRDVFHTLPSSPIPRLDWIRFVVWTLKALGHGDITKDVLRLHPQEDQHKLAACLLHRSWDRTHMPNDSSIPSLDRCLAFVDSRLENVLPRRLKSAILKEV